VHLTLEAFKQFADNVAFVVEVVIEVTRADIQFIGY